MKNRTIKYRSLKERYQILRESDPADSKPDPKPEEGTEPSPENQKRLEDFKKALESAFEKFPENAKKIAEIITGLTVKELRKFIGIATNSGGGDPENKGPEKAKSVEDIISGMTDDEKNSSGINAETHKKLIGFLREKGVIA
jgi:hypothetical protein